MTKLDTIRGLLKKDPNLLLVEIAHKMGIKDRNSGFRTLVWLARKEAGLTGTDTKETEQEDTLDKYLVKHKVTMAELEAVINSAKYGEVKRKSPTIDLGKTGTFKYAVISDTHIGHNKFRYKMWEHFLRVIKRDRCEFVFHPGDHLDGMSGRPGHVYELDAIGFAKQKALAIQLYSQVPIPMYGIDGNHDQWFKQKNDNGTIVGEELQASLKNYTHLGEWEGKLIVSGIEIMAFHANDGTSYAHSYKLQKLCESLKASEKPQILHSGHYHKSLFDYINGIYATESGTLCGQTGFMRGKKLAAEVGFWVMEVEHHKGKVIGCSGKFYHEDMF